MPELITKARKVVRKVGFLGGVPILECTRIRVSDIVVEVEHKGLTPEEVVLEFPTLSVADVFSALTYYYEHSQEIRAEISKRQQDFEQAKAA